MTSFSQQSTVPSIRFSLSRKLILGASCLILSQFAFSDATVVYEQSNGANQSLNSMQIKDGKIRFTPPNQNDNYSLYDSLTGSLTHVNMGQKQYLVMGEKDIAEQANQAKKQMDTMRQRMMEKMKDMPAEQKKQVEQMMNNHLSRVEAQKAPPKVDQKNTSKTETISGIECTVHETYIDGIKNSELCITAPDKMGLNDQDAQALMAMQGFMKRMQKVAQTMMGNNTPTADIEGIPLRTRLYGPDGSVKLETQLKSISQDAINAAKVTIPGDFTAMPMPMPRMQ
ncbi:MAG: hypothetical protein GY694_11750 [Gammaproteobacteria bacterium]|nr:hypothetical protein [Gammaproteobacteria bacterium]